MDLSKTIIAKSDQLNADDLLGGPRTFTIVEVRPGSEEQPVNIVLAEWPRNRPFKPSKTVQRILSYCWGSTETDDWPEGAQMTLYRDEKVKWAGEEIGGIRVSHLSHIDGVQKVALQESKHKKSLHTILPLQSAPAPQAAPEPTAEEVAACTEKDELGRMWKRSGPERRAQIEAQVNALTGKAPTAPDPAPDPADDHAAAIAAEAAS